MIFIHYHEHWVVLKIQSKGGWRSMEGVMFLEINRNNILMSKAQTKTFSILSQCYPNLRRCEGKEIYEDTSGRMWCILSKKIRVTWFGLSILREVCMAQGMFGKILPKAWSQCSRFRKEMELFAMQCQTTRYMTMNCLYWYYTDNKIVFWWSLRVKFSVLGYKKGWKCKANIIFQNSRRYS